MERSARRPSHVQCADGWETVLAPIIDLYSKRKLIPFFRIDGALALPEKNKALEEAGYCYTIRLHANAVLQERIAHRLKRPVVHPPKHVRRKRMSASS